MAKPLKFRRIIFLPKISIVKIYFPLYYSNRKSHRFNTSLVKRHLVQSCDRHSEARGSISLCTLHAQLNSFYFMVNWPDRCNEIDDAASSATFLYRPGGYELCDDISVSLRFLSLNELFSMGFSKFRSLTFLQFFKGNLS